MTTNSLKKSKPQFCIITPTPYLEEYASQSNTHLVLAHIVDNSEEYAEFYRSMSDRGDFLIMDNGAFELGQSYDPGKLIELGHKCGADAIVLPDYPFQDSKKTIDAAITWSPIITDEGFKTMFVPQSEVGELEDWINCYSWASSNAGIDIIGMSILGIPNALPNIPKSYARVVMTEILHDRGIFDNRKYHHYLGLNSAPNVELPALIKSKSLDSCDSSNPVWCGIQGIQYDNTRSDFMGIQKKYLRDVDFNEQWSSKDHIHSTIQHNLDVTLDIFADPSKYL